MNHRYCVEYAKDQGACQGRSGWLRDQLTRMAVAACLPLVLRRSGKPKLVLEDGLPPAWPSERERLWLDCVHAYPSQVLLSRLQGTAPAGIRPLRAYPWRGPARHHQERHFRVIGLPLEPLLERAPQLPHGWIPVNRPASEVRLVRSDPLALDFLLRAQTPPLPSFKELLESLLGQDLPAHVEVLRLAPLVR